MANAKQVDCTPSSTLITAAVICTGSQYYAYAVETFTLAIEKILRDENLINVLPAEDFYVPRVEPKENIAFALYNLCKLFRVKEFEINPETAPKAYELVHSFGPTSCEYISRFQTPTEKKLVIALRVIAGTTLGFVAYVQNDKEKAKGFFEETMKEAGKYDVPVYEKLEDIEHLDFVAMNDMQSCAYFHTQCSPGAPSSGANNIPEQPSVISLTTPETEGLHHVCAQCGVKRVKLVCGKCRKMRYCNANCQKEHWKVHRKSCASPAPTM